MSSAELYMHAIAARDLPEKPPIRARDPTSISWCASAIGKITGVFTKKVSRLGPCCFTLIWFLLCLVQGKP
jgi:hypothetical protein